MLDILAHHPSTAHFISKSLAIRFVSDNPPESLVTQHGATFTATDGDLRQVMTVPCCRLRSSGTRPTSAPK